MILRRGVRFSAGLALVAATAGTAAWLAPGSLFSAADRGEMLPLSVQYEQGAPFNEFVRSDPKHRERWLRAYDESTSAVEPLLSRLEALRGSWRLLVVAEGYCTDALNSVPHLARLAAESPNLDVRILQKDEASALLEAYRLDGEGRIPLVIVLNQDLAERGVWIERPAALRAAVAEWKADPAGDVGASIRAWYAADGGRSALAEVVALLEQADAGGRVVPSAAMDIAPTQCSGD
jgi:hypothetical protein